MIETNFASELPSITYTQSPPNCECTLPDLFPKRPAWCSCEIMRTLALYLLEANRIRTHSIYSLLKHRYLLRILPFLSNRRFEFLFFCLKCRNNAKTINKTYAFSTPSFVFFLSLHPRLPEVTNFAYKFRSPAFAVAARTTDIPTRKDAAPRRTKNIIPICPSLVLLVADGAVPQTDGVSSLA